MLICIYLRAGTHRGLEWSTLHGSQNSFAVENMLHLTAFKLLECIIIVFYYIITTLSAWLYNYHSLKPDYDIMWGVQE